jgi:hypothetical protein
MESLAVDLVLRACHQRLGNDAQVQAAEERLHANPLLAQMLGENGLSRLDEIIVEGNEARID